MVRKRFGPVPSPKSSDPWKRWEDPLRPRGKHGRIEERKEKYVHVHVYIQGGNTNLTERTAEGEEKAEEDDREQKRTRRKKKGAEPLGGEPLLH